MPEIINCPFLDKGSGICKAITLNIFAWPSKASFHTGGGFCTVQDNLAEQGDCTRHPQFKIVQEAKSELNLKK